MTRSYRSRGSQPSALTTRLAVAALAAMLVLAACDPVVSTLPGARRPMEPLPIYPQWFAETETCSGLEGDYELIEWYTTDHIQLEDGTRLRGQWWWPHDIIILDGLQDYDFLVKHEMLHELLRGDQEHEREEWRSCRLHPSDES